MREWFTFLFGWMLRIDVLSLVLGTLLGTLLSAWYGLYLHRPVLKVIGGGGGGGKEFRSSSIRMTNSPGTFGVRLGETIIPSEGNFGSCAMGFADRA